MDYAKIEINDSENNQIGTLQVRNVTDFPLALNESISDISEPAKRKGSHSLTFKVPAVAENNKTFKALYDANILDESSVFSKKPIKIVINGIQYKHYTHLKVKTATSVSGNVMEYSCVVFGENMAWAIRLQEIGLCDLTWLYDGQEDFVYNRANVEKGWSPFQTPAEFNNYDYVFPFISYGTFPTINDLRPALRVLNIIKKGLTEIGYTLDSTFLESDEFNTKIMSYWGDAWKIDEDRRLGKAFHVRRTSNLQGNAIFHEPDNTWTDPLNPRRGGVYPMSQAQIEQYSDIIQVRQDLINGVSGVDDNSPVTFSVSQRVPFPHENSDPNDHWDNVNYQTTAIEKGMVNFQMLFDDFCVKSAYDYKENGSFEDYGSAHTYRVDVVLNVYKENINTGAVEIIGSLDESFFSEKEYNLVLNRPVSLVVPYDCLGSGNDFETGFVLVDHTKHVVYAEIMWTWQVPLKRFSNTDRKHKPPIIRVKNLEFKMEASDALVDGMYMEALKNYLDCEYSVMDIIEGIAPVFNLYFKADVTQQTVKIEPRDSFYADNTSAIDWSSKLDVGSQYEIESLSDLPQTWIFRWRDDTNDAHLKQYKKLNNDRHFGQYELTLSDKFVANKTKVVASKVFGTAVTKEFVEKRVGGSGIPWFATMAKDLGSEVEFGTGFVPRLLNYKYSTHRDSNNDLCLIIWYDSFTLLYSYPVGYAIHAYEDEETNLMYHDVVFPNGDEARGLFHDYWKKTMNTINAAKLLVGKFLLKDKDMFNVDLKIPVFLSKPPELFGYWIIDRINNFKPTANVTTTVKLLKRQEFDISNDAIDDTDIALAGGEAPENGGLGIANGVDDAYFED